MKSFEEMKELRFKKNVLGALLTVCGTYLVLTSAAFAFTFGRVPNLVVISVLAFGIMVMIAGLFFMETLIKGSSLVFSGIQLVLFDQLFLLIDDGVPDSASFLIRMGMPILIVGIILVMIGFRE